MVNQRFQGKNVKAATTQTSAAVMVVLLCMTIFKGSWTQDEDEIIHGQNIREEFDYTTPSCKIQFDSYVFTANIFAVSMIPYHKAMVLPQKSNLPRRFR